MSPLDFCYWLRGYFEIAGETQLTKEQAEVISKHLALVFNEKAKDTPPISQQVQDDLEKWLEDQKTAHWPSPTVGQGRFCTTVSCKGG